MAGVDELTAELGDLAVRPVPGTVRVHPATDALGGRLVHGAGDALVGEGERGGQAGDPATNDGYPGGGCRRRVSGPAQPGRNARRESGADDGAAPDELA